jgi:hypothetical protein
MGKQREELQAQMAQLLNKHGAVYSRDDDAIDDLWELVEVHFASKCTDHQAEARSDERAKVLAKIEAIVAAPAPVAWGLLDKLRAYLRGDKP